MKKRRVKWLKYLLTCHKFSQLLVYFPSPSYFSLKKNFLSLSLFLTLPLFLSPSNPSRSSWKSFNSDGIPSSSWLLKTLPAFGLLIVGCHCPRGLGNFPIGYTCHFDGQLSMTGAPQLFICSPAESDRSPFVALNSRKTGRSREWEGKTLERWYAELKLYDEKYTQKFVRLLLFASFQISFPKVVLLYGLAIGNRANRYKAYQRF